MGTIFLILLVIFLIVFGIIAMLFWGGLKIITSGRFWIAIGVVIFLWIFFAVFPGLHIIVGIFNHM